MTEIGYHVFAMTSEGVVLGLAREGWTIREPHLFQTVSFARHYFSKIKPPADAVDAYIWSTEHEVSFSAVAAELTIVPEALAMVRNEVISYANAEILSRLPGEYQVQFLGEARDFLPSEFADVVHGALRRLTFPKTWCIVKVCSTTKTSR